MVIIFPKTKEAVHSHSNPESMNMEMIPICPSLISNFQDFNKNTRQVNKGELLGEEFLNISHWSVINNYFLQNYILNA